MEILCFQYYYFEIKRRYSSFVKKVFVFQKISFKHEVVKTFKISSGCHKNMPISQTEGYFENP